MKLAIVTAYPPSKVTLTEYGYHLVKHFRLQKEVTEIILITDKTKGEKDLNFEEKGCKVTVKECWNFNDHTNVFKVNKVIASTKPDAVLFNLQFLKFGDKNIPAALGLILPLLCKLKGIPTISLMHNIIEQVDLNNTGIISNNFFQKIYSGIGNLLTKLVLTSDVVAVTMGKYQTILENKYQSRNVALIPHGSFETPEEPDFTLPAGPKKILAFGKFGTYKKLEIMIDAIELIRRRTNQNLEIVIAGTDSPNTPGYLESVKKKYAHVDQLCFTGYVEEGNVPTIFEESAVVVFPYTSTTGSSGVLHQAGSYGKAVVLPELGDLSTLIKEEGYKGEFFNSNSVSSLADAIENILVHDSYREYLAKANYRAASAIPMSKVAKMYIEYFKVIQVAKSKGFTLDVPLVEKNIVF
ncbi:Glycosyltransferase involved in cell wall bisynthesis [Maribacter dokdonensis]|uniref:Glycosyltransferase involved in cell wall bisynthesis n=1 Tax=Maribacter dokdonensis TaxID=320912 RepID=A0ABY0UKG2_9FLAO|nr:glycosyltransferase [Maribacter dokdonensis]SDS82520.1 Glycosyltransferase involved in cell wall bisynthesis [Maribacter dokdonensis]